MTHTIDLYAARTIGIAERIVESINRGNRAQAMADCSELHEVTNRLYSMLFKLNPVLPDAIDPLTLRFRKYDEERRTGEAGVSEKPEG